jgi:hypothetical protein
MEVWASDGQCTARPAFAVQFVEAQQHLKQTELLWLCAEVLKFKWMPRIHPDLNFLCFLSVLFFVPSIFPVYCICLQ